LKVLATVVGTLFKNWEYTWLFPELEESVLLELDFLQEATNGERVGRLLERDRRIHIPRVRWDLSSARVLTMEFIDGVKVTDVETLRSKGIDPRAVGETISNLFSLMVFSLGLTHCDPHPGRAREKTLLPFRGGCNVSLLCLRCVFLPISFCSHS
jgi:aarF domain-containing kinase